MRMWIECQLGWIRIKRCWNVVVVEKDSRRSLPLSLSRVRTRSQAAPPSIPPQTTIIFYRSPLRQQPQLSPLELFPTLPSSRASSDATQNPSLDLLPPSRLPEQPSTFPRSTRLSSRTSLGKQLRAGTEAILFLQPSLLLSPRVQRDQGILQEDEAAAPFQLSPPPTSRCPPSISLVEARNLRLRMETSQEGVRWTVSRERSARPFFETDEIRPMDGPSSRTNSSAHLDSQNILPA